MRLQELIKEARGGAEGVTSSMEMITPSIAKQYLATAADNRSLRRTVLARYTADMQNGTWDITGDSIKFNKDGRLIDGQHRLTACIRAGRAFRSVVVRGVEDCVVRNIDGGTPRNLADGLAIAGEKNTSKLAGAIKFYWRWRQGKLHMHALNPTRYQALKTLQENPEIRIHVNRWIRMKTIPSALAGFMSFACRNCEAADIDEFLVALHRGVGLNEGNPVLHLRTWIHNAKSRRALERATLVHATVKAWNLWAYGNTIKRFVLRSGEEFPELEV